MLKCELYQNIRSYELAILKVNKLHQL